MVCLRLLYEIHIPFGDPSCTDGHDEVEHGQLVRMYVIPDLRFVQPVEDVWDEVVLRYRLIPREGQL